MKIFKKYTEISDDSQGAVVAMGNFDGVHLGHQSVIALARAIAATINAPLGVITFEPHPRQLFTPDAPAFRLMSADTRAHRINKLGIDALYELPFNTKLSQLTAEEFARDVLSNGLHVKHVVIGADFRFGKGRQGDAPMLEDLGAKLGFGVTIAPLISDEKGDYSSSAIREALSEGHPEDAARILGHWHRIDGIVEKGDQRGRELGFPTANISLDDLHLPKFGVYTVLFAVSTRINRADRQRLRHHRVQTLLVSSQNGQLAALSGQFQANMPTYTVATTCDDGGLTFKLHYRSPYY